MKKPEHSFPYYPLFLNISGKRCVVAGGGDVALRKVRVLLEHGANVVVISPDLCSGLAGIVDNSHIQVHRRPYRQGDLNDAFIAIAATDSKEVNLEIMKEAHDKAVLINIVDDAENSDFIVPAHMRREDIAIAISTAGKSPALARKIRTKLEKEFGEEYVDLGKLIGEARFEIKKQGLKISNDVWQQSLDLDTLTDLLKKGDREKARAFLYNKLGIH
jgi:precorrin-2 dehydrogenase/sirohydrochlorin ferrochelatase